MRSHNGKDDLQAIRDWWCDNMGALDEILAKWNHLNPTAPLTTSTLNGYLRRKHRLLPMETAKMSWAQIAAILDRDLEADAKESETSGPNATATTKGNPGDSQQGKGGPPDDGNRFAILEKLRLAQRKAYLSNEYAERKAGKPLKAQEAYHLIRDEGFDEKMLDECPKFAELHGYRLPMNAGTWKTHLSRARTSLGENRYQRRRGLPEGRSIVKQDEIEYRGDE